MKTPRNDPCHCGSQKKYKKCCLREDEKKAAPKPLKIRADHELTPEERKARHEARMKLAAFYSISSAFTGRRR